jgi:2-polyprenyl-3-methyl-5-hydroxy-6-metoxy-1,4-benzoquinol methylase
MPRIVKRLIHKAGQAYIRRICFDEFKQQRFRWHNERSIEYRFALEALTTSRPIRVLDVGTGTTAWPHLLRTCGYVVTAIDNVRDYWPSGMLNRHWAVINENIVHPSNVSSQYDAITCISVLEHIVDHVAAVRNMATLLKTGGLLILTTPYSHRDPCPNVYAHPNTIFRENVPYICRSSSAAELESWLSCGLVLERQELWRLFTGPVWATGDRCNWTQVMDLAERHQLGCFVFRKSDVKPLSH